MEDSGRDKIVICENTMAENGEVTIHQEKDSEIINHNLLATMSFVGFANKIIYKIKSTYLIIEMVSGCTSARILDFENTKQNPPLATLKPCSFFFGSLENVNYTLNFLNIYVFVPKFALSSSLIDQPSQAQDQTNTEQSLGFTKIASAY